MSLRQVKIKRKKRENNYLKILDQKNYNGSSKFSFRSGKNYGSFS